MVSRSKNAYNLNGLLNCGLVITDAYNGWFVRKMSNELAARDARLEIREEHLLIDRALT